MEQVKIIDLDSLLKVAVDTANKMCNSDKWKVEFDWLDGDNLVVNVSLVSGSTFKTKEEVADANGYCSDICDIVEDILKTYSCEEWVRHSERWYWDPEGNEIECEVDSDEEAICVATVQTQFYKS